jgi:hypothetical protein
MPGFVMTGGNHRLAIGKSSGVDDVGAFGPCSAYGEARFGLTVLRDFASGDGFAVGILFKGEQTSRIGIRSPF